MAQPRAQRGVSGAGARHAGGDANKGEVRARALTAPGRALFTRSNYVPKKMAPEGGSAPPTSRLTVARSAS